MSRYINNLTEVVLGWMARIFPVTDYKLSEVDLERLNKKHAWVNGTGDALCLVGFGLGVWLPEKLLGEDYEYQIWDGAVMFGLAVWLPILGIVGISLMLGGKKRLEEFLMIYSLRFKIHWKSLTLFVFLPLMILGGFGAFMVYG